MGFFDQIKGLFSRDARDESQLLKGLKHAKEGRPQQALAIYEALLKDGETSNTTRARALFNRALAYSAMKNDTQAECDLREVLAMPNLPENVQSAARTQLSRVKKRNE